jgi:hypothetical protein
MEAPVMTTTFPETLALLEFIFKISVFLCDLCGSFATFAVKALNRKGR